MRKNNLRKKLAVLSLISLFTFSIFLSTNVKAYKVSQLSNYIGHKYSEEAWSILYDFAGNELVEDYNPGPYADDVTQGLTDNNTEVDSKFFGAYTNYHGVQSFYLALQNFTWDEDVDKSHYGCSPFQVLLQHFKPDGYDDIHVFIVNRFLGLLAYKDTGNIEDLPDENDDLFMGWGFYSEFHKAIVNSLFENQSIPDNYKFDESQKCTATPIPLEKEGNTYKYGMTYENVFVLWQKLEIEEGADEDITAAEIVNFCSAFGLLESLSFTYIVSYEEVDDDTLAVSTSVEYDIGQFSEAWIVGDSQATADKFGGKRYGFFKDLVYLSYYGKNDLPKRLAGDDSTPGFSLAVINTANTFVINTTAAIDSMKVNEEFQDQDENDLGGVTDDIDEALLEFADDPAYKIDFAGKPKYTWNDTQELDAPTRTLKNNRVKTGFNWIEAYTNLILSGIVYEATKSSGAGVWKSLRAAWDFGNVTNSVDFYYLVCFPTWQGETINQDPTFTAYVVSDLTSEGRRIPGYEPLFFSLIGCGAGIYIIYMSRIKKKFELK